MKIVKLETFVVDGGSQNWVFVEVHTDEGITGLGEATVATKALSVEAAIKEQECYLLGQDPFKIEHLWQTMYRRPRWRGGPILCSAISGIEVALWDIKGKALGVPIYELLGGVCRDKIRMYTSVRSATPEQAAENAKRLVEEHGYTAVKDVPWIVKDGIARRQYGIREGAKKVEAIRKAVGDDIEILLDVHSQMTPPMALDLAQRIAEYRPFFLEETMDLDDLDGLEWLSKRTNIPLATGERLFTKFGFRDVIDRHLVSYIQPDMAHAGGLFELKKIAAMAEAHFIEVAPHNPLSDVTTMASIHLCASTLNCIILEHIGPMEGAEPQRKPIPWKKEIFEGEVVIKDGFAELPTKPGLGIELNKKEIAKHPYSPKLRPQWFWEDGSIALW